MAMYSIRLDGDTRAMRRRIRSVSEIDKQGINAALAEGVRESTLERFKQSKRPGRAQVEDLHPRRARGRQDAHPVRAAPQLHPRQVGRLRLRGRHERQVCGDASVREPGRTIRARKKKALRFQVGGKWVTKKQVRITVPARPFLGLSEDDMQEMKATVEEFIQKED